MRLHPAHLKVVQMLLQKHFPGIEVRAFGSRVLGTAKEWSDLDLVLVSAQKLPLTSVEKLSMDFAESDLPFRVDILDWHDISTKFRALIEEQYEILQTTDMLNHSSRKVFLFGIPSSTGCLEEGTEISPEHFRQNGILEKLRDGGRNAIDLGNVALPPFQRHNTPPIRNYPTPKIVWEYTADFLKTNFPEPTDGLLLCIGGDCNIIVGTTAGMLRRFGRDHIHLLCLDGDVDSLAPNPQQCAGSAGMGLWLATQESNYWNGQKISSSQITVIGNKEGPPTEIGIPCLPLKQLRKKGATQAVRDVLAAIPKERHILVHLDVDVLSQNIMPAAYSPREPGLSLDELEQILKIILTDNRVKFMELTEFIPSKDPEGKFARAIIDTITSALKNMASVTG